MIPCVHLAGVQSRAKYLLFPVSIACLATFCMILMDQWYKGVAAIQNKFSLIKTDLQSLPRRLRNAYLVFLWIGAPTVNAVVPMIVFDDKTSLNWAYCLSVTYNGILSIVVSSVLVYTTFQLIISCTPDKEVGLSDDLSAVLRKVNTTTVNTTLPLSGSLRPQPHLLVLIFCLALVEDRAGDLVRVHHRGDPVHHLSRVDGGDRDPD